VSEGTASEIRSSLNHPVIDADGHIAESMPALYSLARQIGGADIVRRVQNLYAGRDTSPAAGVLDWTTWYNRDAAERRDRRTQRPSWWVLPASNWRDRATAMLPRLLHERLPSLGIDFAVCYPTAALGFIKFADDEARRVMCRAYNTLYAAEFDGLGDRLTPVGVLPTHTPDEAIEELEHAVTLGMKAFVVSGGVYRAIDAVQRVAPEVAYLATWMDPMGIDSAYDYDPLWARCEELGVAIASHGGTSGFGTRRSISNFMFNHSGHFAAGGEAFAKALWMGGVTRRFPNLNFAFLEGGVAWAAALVNDLTELWHKRNGESVHQYDPSRLDAGAVREALDIYGSDRLRELVADQSTWEVTTLSIDREDPEMLDDWRACKVSSADDLVSLFVDHFYFGCEADDRLVSVGFDRRLLPSHKPLRSMFSSDIGHYDVPDMEGVLPEAYEQLEHGMLTSGDFEDFMAANTVRFYAKGNPDFFRGTTVEAYAAAVVTRDVASAA
jgi:predicted TIM-barrel fold metal-dependent hydrolase